MKRLLIALLLLGFGYVEGAVINPVMTSVCSHTSTGYQGFAYDGTYFYTGSNTDNKVYKILGTDCSAVSDFACPTYCAAIDIRTDHDNLIAVTGYTNAPVVWEITKTGTKVREWDFSLESEERSYNRAGLVAYYAENQILLFTAGDTTPYPFKISLYTLADNGTFTWVKTWSHTGLKAAQGMWWDATRRKLYFAATETQNTDNRIYELTLNDDNSITVGNYAQVAMNGTYTEIEGISVYSGELYYQTWVDSGPYQIRKIDFNNAFYPRGAKFNGMALGSDDTKISKINGVKWGKATGSIDKFNNAMYSSYYCNAGWPNCRDYPNGADLVCEVWDSTTDGVCNWTIGGMTNNYCTITFNATPDNDPALGCTDIQMTYIFDLNKTSTSAAACGMELDLGATNNTWYVQYYVKIISEGLADGNGATFGGIAQTTAGQFEVMNGFTQAGGNLYFKHSFHQAAGWTDDTGGTAISTDTWYGIRYLYDQSGGAGAGISRWWVDYANDGTWTQEQDVTNATFDRTATRYPLLGDSGAPTKLYHFQIAGYKISSTGFPAGCER